MYKLELKDFILSHDNWEELLTQDPYNLKISRDNGYIMFKYNQLSSDFSIPLVREARGIIFTESNWQCVCRAFDKFGNYGESYVPELDWNNGVSVQEKVDGSLMKIWHWTDGWHLSTNGSIDAFHTETQDAFYSTFGLLFERALKEYEYNSFEEFVDTLEYGFTYMFELATEKNRVVIPYEGYHIYYLGQREMITMQECDYREVFTDIEVPKIYTMNTLQDVEDAAENLPWDEEGYVCVDEDFNRCKIKSPAYVRAHYARNNNVISTKKLIEVVLNNEIEEFCIYCSDYKDKLFEIQSKMEKVKQKAIEYFAKHLFSMSNRKDFSQSIKDVPEPYKSFLFCSSNVEKLWNNFIKDWTVNKWEKIINEIGE